MFDIWIGDINPANAVLIGSVAILLPIQLLLCFKVKSKVIRLLPVVLLSIPTVFLITMSLTQEGWTGVAYLFLAMFAGFMLLMCGVGWGIWAMIEFIKKVNHTKAK